MPDQEIRISEYDKTQMSALAIGAVEEFMVFGSPSTYIERALHEAFKLGFTAVHRGEADGQEHPPKPEWMTSDEPSKSDA